MNRLPASPSPHTHPWRVRIETAEWWPAVFGFLGFAAAGNAWAGPEGMAVAAGSASVAHHSAVTTISVSDRAILNWASFNVAAGETARFVQPSPVSIVWNQISSANPSQIFGSIEANGIVILANEAG